MGLLMDVIDWMIQINSSFLKWNIAHGREILDVMHVIFDNIFYVFLCMTVFITTVYLVLSVSAVLSRKRHKEKSFDSSNAPFITIQIPTRNESIALRCAENCLGFDYPKDRYEVLIGDDSDDPAISGQLAEFAGLHERVKVIKRQKNIGFKPGNLNNMLKHSKGDYIVVFDSDFTPGRDFLKRIIAPFQHNKNLSAVQARWNFNNFNQNYVTVLASTIVYVFHHIVLTFLKKHNTGTLCGSAEAVKKSDLIKLGRWKSGSLTEDIEYSLRLHKNNKGIMYLPELECYSDVPHKAKDLYKQQMRWAYGVISSYIEHAGSLIINRSISIKRKALSFFAGFGYVLPVMILALFTFGTLSFLTHRPGPIDLPRFFSEMTINILLTSGLIIASIVSLYRAKKARYLAKMLLSSFSVGIITTFYVNKGIFKSVLGKPMEWYLLDKDTAGHTAK
ncbi:glycosyltransferase [Candidatus Woesearchaeota archaeon]|nr:glycosyltransferase [Candidatus Woesearchaeota archaeon]